MDDSISQELHRRAAAHLHYVASEVPSGVWRAADGVLYDIRDMSINQLDRCVARVRDDLLVLSYPICTSRYGDHFSKPAQAKLDELLQVREALMNLSPA